MHIIYAGTIACTINENSGHSHCVEIPNSLNFPKGIELLISTQYWAYNSTSYNAKDTTLYGTQCVTHHCHVSLIWGGGTFICTVPLDKFFSLYRLRLDIIHSIYIVLILFITHFCMMISLTLSLTPLLL